MPSGSDTRRDHAAHAAGDRAPRRSLLAPPHPGSSRENAHPVDRSRSTGLALASRETVAESARLRCARCCSPSSRRFSSPAPGSLSLALPRLARDLPPRRLRPRVRGDRRRLRRALGRRRVERHGIPRRLRSRFRRGRRCGRRPPAHATLRFAGGRRARRATSTTPCLQRSPSSTASCWPTQARSACSPRRTTETCRHTISPGPPSGCSSTRSATSTSARTRG